MDLEDSDSGDDLGSILVSEQELGKSGESTSSTIIGKSPPVGSGSESDIRLAGDSSKASASDVQLVTPAGSSDLNLASTSGVTLAGASDLKLAGGDTGKHSASDIMLGSGKLDFATDSALDLGSDDLVLGGSGVGSDVTLGGGDSGINLAKPADSGISLEEEPLDLMGSNVDTFELPEDDDVVSLSDIGAAGPEEPTLLKQDEEFLLSPAGDLGGDDSDSGSQVIALEDSEAFDENQDTMLRPGQPAIPGLVVEEETLPPLGMSTGITPTAAPAYAPQPAETPYTKMNIAALASCVLLLGLCGMLMTDVLRNMWAFDSDTMVSTSLMDGILAAFNIK
jgi:hypothetical protein